MSEQVTTKRGILSALGVKTLTGVRYAGGMVLLIGSIIGWVVRGMSDPKVRLKNEALSAQMVRVGVKSLGVVVLVQVFVGVILALQLTPPLAEFHQQEQVPRIIGLAGFRMLGPILAAVVLSGFAGASIAAEIGTMVTAEEIEAMEAFAINPIRFLVVPRVLATTIMMVLLTVVSDWMIALGGYLTSYFVLGPESYVGYWLRMEDQLKYLDFITGLIQAAVFGLLISVIACHEGLKVTGGAEGVGRATTMTVVYSITAIIIAACICTIIFYTFKI